MTAQRDKKIAHRLLADGFINKADQGLNWRPGKLTFDEHGRAVSLGLKTGSSIPPDVWKLDHLTRLGVNALEGEVSVDIAKLQKLTHLAVHESKMRTIPDEVGHLPLRVLELTSNRLETLPPSLGNLPKSTKIELGGNPLAEPYASLYKEGWPALRNYLRSLQSQHDEPPEYEAKVLLVGEGGVGKSTLLAALRRQPFIENRSTTHGIEIQSVDWDHPDEDISAPLTLNFWDFGGQEVYRVTHQFFFSAQAVYLLVWKPREGAEENSIAGWLHRIRIRVGGNVKVLLVATHADERHPELDYPSLRAEFGNMLAGNFCVDSQTGTNIAELQAAIRDVAGALPHGRVPFNPTWIAARKKIMATAATHVTREVFVATTAEHGLDRGDALALLNILHTLGHLVHWDVPGLEDFVVLKPEWLTKAIGFVLEDKPTRKTAGVLDHRRLAAIWDDHGRPTPEPRYPLEHYPFFLRLMEQYDVSARSEATDHSLVAQLVPWERPQLPWTRAEADGRPSMSLTCMLPHEPPGLVSWTTVRNHRWSTGTHWRRGVFLRHDDGHEALIELVDRLGAKELIITVRGHHPSHFVSLLRDGLERLIERRWAWLRYPEPKYTFMVPCNHAGCSGRFPLDFLLQVISETGVVHCQSCVRPSDVVKLLYGHTTTRETLRQQLDAVLAGQAEASRERQFHAAQAAEMTRRMLRAFLSDANRGPRLFSLEPVERAKWNPKQIGTHRYRVQLWCEHPGHEHALPDACLEFDRPKAWLQSIAPYAILVADCLRLAVPIAAAAAGLPIAGIPAELKPQLAFVKSLNALLPEDEPAKAKIGGLMGSEQVSTAEGAGLHMLHELLAELDWKPGKFGLGKVTSKATGDVLWVCSEHRLEYEPGLPVLPEMLPPEPQ